MKKILITASALTLCACTVPDNATGIRSDEAGTEADRTHYIWTDPDTGCDYVKTVGYPEAVMPRISSDGFHVHCADQKAGRVVISPEGAAQ